MNDKVFENKSELLPPFFIIGSVRSGTTIVRDVLRRHQNLECPEETHYFRFGEAFGTKRYSESFLRSDLVRKHLSMDGITPFDFGVTLQLSESKRDFATNFGNYF